MLVTHTMLVNGNLVGFAMFVFTAAIIVTGKFVFGLPDPLVMIGAGATLFIADMILRIVNRGDQSWLMGARTGGYLFFIPVWTFGVAVVLINAISSLVKTK
ncbi:hypothetical protein BH10ACI2_BH10ACI2_15120 [soil metagenome]